MSGKTASLNLGSSVFWRDLGQVYEKGDFFFFKGSNLVHNFTVRMVLEKKDLQVFLLHCFANNHLQNPTLEVL